MWPNDFPSIDDMNKLWKKIGGSGPDKFKKFRKLILENGIPKQVREKIIIASQYPNLTQSEIDSKLAAGAPPECFGSGNEKAWCSDCPWLGECKIK